MEFRVDYTTQKPGVYVFSVLLIDSGLCHYFVGIFFFFFWFSGKKHKILNV